MEAGRGPSSPFMRRSCLGLTLTGSAALRQLQGHPKGRLSPHQASSDPLGPTPSTCVHTHGAMALPPLLCGGIMDTCRTLLALERTLPDSGPEGDGKRPQGRGGTVPRARAPGKLGTPCPSEADHTNKGNKPTRLSASGAQRS